MALPTSYLTSTKRLSEIFDAIKTAKAPDKFTTRFLVALGFKSNGDRLVINVLKSIGFLDDTGQPTDRYFRFMDQSQSAIILAEGIEDAYSDLFEVRKDAYNLSKSEVVGKFKTLSQGQYSDAVISFMGMTFLALCGFADFETAPAKIEEVEKPSETNKELPKANISTSTAQNAIRQTGSPLNFGGLVYNIQIVLPETRDPKVYDALFKSLKEHLQ